MMSRPGGSSKPREQGDDKRDADGKPNDDKG